MHRADNSAPYDFHGSTPTGAARLFNVDALTTGPHGLEAIVQLRGGAVIVVSSSINVRWSTICS